MERRCVWFAATKVQEQGGIRKEQDITDVFWLNESDQEADLEYFAFQ